jgi:hypothetical protein
MQHHQHPSGTEGHTSEDDIEHAFQTSGPNVTCQMKDAVPVVRCGPHLGKVCTSYTYRRLERLYSTDEIRDSPAWMVPLDTLYAVRESHWCVFSFRIARSSFHFFFF